MALLLNIDMKKQATGGALLLCLLVCGPLAMAQDVRLALDGRWEAFFSQADDSSLTYNDVWGWEHPRDGRQYAIVGSLDSIHFIDVTDSGDYRQVVARAGRAREVVHRDFKTHQHYVYATGDEGASGLQVFDLQYLPDSVVKVYESTKLFVRAHNIFIEGERLYAAGVRTLRYDHPLSVISLFDPERPVLLAHLEENQTGIRYVHDVFVHQDTAYCAAAGQGLFVVDLTNPFSPEVIEYLVTYPEQGYNHSGWLHLPSRQFVMADETHGKRLKVVDTGTGEQELAVTALFGRSAWRGSIPHNPFVRDSLVFVSYYHEGLQVFGLDTQGGTLPHLAGYDTHPQNDLRADDGNRYEGFSGCWGVYPFFSDGLVVASDMQRGLFGFRLQEQSSILDNGMAPHPGEAKMVVYPNPFKRHITLAPVSPLHRVHLRLINAQGQDVLRRFVTELAAPLRIEIPSGLSGPQLYLLHLQHADGTFTRRVLSRP